MPTLTGSVADVTGVALSPAQIRQVFVKAPGERPSLADGGVLIVSAPVQLGSSGSLSVTLEPGPAVLTVDTYAGGPDVYDLYVTADMTLLSEAIDEAAPERDRLWAESVMVQLRDEAVAAAGRAVAAAGDVDDAIAGAADAVVAAVESDRVAAESAAGAAASSASAAGVSAGDASAAAGAAAQSASEAAGSASAAASSAGAASRSATSAAGSATDAAGAVTDARAARDAAEGHATSAAGSASAAAGSAAAADGHAGRAEAAANEFDLTATSSTLAPGAAATVKVSGDGPAYSLEFGVPQGEKGDKGDQGEISQAQLDAAVASLVDNAPEALDTLTELAAALGNDPNFATTVSTQIGERAKTSDVNAALAGKADVGAEDTATWDGVTGKPATFPPSAHKHPVTDLDATGTRSASTYLRGDGSWATPPDTTYSVPTQAEAEAGTATTGRAFSAQRVAQGAIAASGKKDWQGTQAQYDALGTKDADRTYWIV